MTGEKFDALLKGLDKLGLRIDGVDAENKLQPAQSGAVLGSVISLLSCGPKLNRQ